MEVGSVSGSVSGFAPAQNGKPESVARTEAAQRVEREQPREEERPPAPVVNTQGQTTGRIVNTSA